VEHFEDDDDNDNHSNDVEYVSIHGPGITRRYPRRQAIPVGANEKARSDPMPKKYDADLTKYWLDSDGSRIHSSCRIHLPTWFAELISVARTGWFLAAISAAIW
jgi:hypothetical protein